MTPHRGNAGHVELVVSEADTAQTYGSGDVPVLATPKLVAIIEQACLSALNGHLDEGQTTVGLAIDLKHFAPTVVGRMVAAEARLDSVDGRKLTFSCRVFEGEQEIARARHVRVAVDRADFLARAEK